MIRPDYYKDNGKDLLELMQLGLLTNEEYRGFMKGNVFKYVKRYNNKNGVEDLEKALTYANILLEFEKSNSKKNPWKLLSDAGNELLSKIRRH